MPVRFIERVLWGGRSRLRAPAGPWLALAIAVWGATPLLWGNPASAAPGAAADLGAPPAPFRAPYIPDSDGEVLQEVPSLVDPAVVQMRDLRGAFDAAPRSLQAATQLANAYVDYSRQIGDAHFAGYAEAVIAPWVHAPNPPAAALVTQAVILQYRHLFDQARDLLRQALGEDHVNAQAWLTLATLDMVQGDYESAARDCSQVSNSAGAEIGLTCFASLRSYTGQARQSFAVLQQVDTMTAKAAPGFRAWIQGLLAENAERLGDWDAAETHYRKALELQPRDNFLLVAYADFLLDRSRPREVLPLLADHTQSDTAFLRLALAQAALQAIKRSVTPGSWRPASRRCACAEATTSGARNHASPCCCSTILRPRWIWPCAIGKSSARPGMLAWSWKPPWPPGNLRPQPRCSNSSRRRSSKTPRSSR